MQLSKGVRSSLDNIRTEGVRPQRSDDCLNTIKQKVEYGKIRQGAMNGASITESDILQTARLNQAMESISQIKHAVLEASGGISIVPEAPAIERKLARIGAALECYSMAKAECIKPCF